MFSNQGSEYVMEGLEHERKGWRSVTVKTSYRVIVGLKGKEFG